MNPLIIAASSRGPRPELLPYVLFTSAQLHIYYGHRGTRTRTPWLPDRRSLWQSLLSRLFGAHRRDGTVQRIIYRYATCARDSPSVQGLQWGKIGWSSTRYTYSRSERRDLDPFRRPMGSTYTYIDRLMMPDFSEDNN